MEHQYGVKILKFVSVQDTLIVARKWATGVSVFWMHLKQHNIRGILNGSESVQSLFP